LNHPVNRERSSTPTQTLFFAISESSGCYAYILKDMFSKVNVRERSMAFRERHVLETPRHRSRQRILF